MMDFCNIDIGQSKIQFVGLISDKMVFYFVYDR